MSTRPLIHVVHWFRTGSLTRVSANAALLATVESFAGGAAWFTLLVYSRLYPPAEYSRLMLWLACQQLIVVVAPFGSSSAVARLLQGSDARVATRVYAFLPRYTYLNLPWAVPLALALAWLSTRGSFLQASWWEASVVVATGAVSASQRSQQQVNVLVGQTRRYTIERTLGGLVSLAVSLALALAGVDSLLAFFGGLGVGLTSVAVLRRTYPGTHTEVGHFAGMYTEVFRQSWVFGAWSVFGWFSGLGGTLILGRYRSPVTVAVYGQVLAVVSLVQIGLAAGVNAVQAHLVGGAVQWNPTIERRINALFDQFCVATAVVAAVLVLLRAELLTPFVLRLAWPPYVWVYFYAVITALTLYQRVMLRYTYDRTVQLSWINLAVGEVLAIGAFAIVLLWNPNDPLAANAALLGVRTIALYVTHQPLYRAAQVRKMRTIALGVALTASLWQFCAWWQMAR